jgi:hypothetical protein
VGVARDHWDTAAFRRHLAAQLERHAATVDPVAREALVAKASYQRADAGDAAALAGALDQAKGPVVAYLALPPAAFAPMIQALATVGLPDRSRVVVEKPFGRSLAEARSLNQLLGRCFGEKATFRADYFLGLQTVQNLLGLRFANRVFEPVWNAGHVERVEVVWDETVDLQGRAGYYDHAGALRDVVQNHLLQLVCLTAMEPPARLDPDRLHDRKVELLRASSHRRPGSWPPAPSGPATSPGGSTASTCPPTFTSRGWTQPAAPRPSPRSSWRSTTTDGAGCRSGCEPARPSPAGAPRSSSTSGRHRIRPSRRRPAPPPTCSGWGLTLTT